MQTPENCPVGPKTDATWLSLVLCNVPECTDDFVIQGYEQLLVVLLWLPGHFELHVGDLLDDILHGIVDRVPANFVLTGELRHCLLRCIVEANDDLHHPNCLCQWAQHIVVGEAILLQEVFADDLGDLESALLILGERILTDELYDLLQIIFLLQDFLHLLLQHAVFSIVLFEVRLQDADVLGEGDVPIDGREVLALCELLVQTPENLHDAQCGGSHWVCEISSWGRDSTDDCDGPLSRRIAQALYFPTSLIEGSQACSQIRWVTSVCRHFGQSPRDLSHPHSSTGT